MQHTTNGMLSQGWPRGAAARRLSIFRYPAAMDGAKLTDTAGSARGPREPARAVRLPEVDTDRCTGCGRCVAACDLHLLSLETLRWTKSAVLHASERCTGCSDCAVTCPFHAITMRTPTPAAGFDA